MARVISNLLDNAVGFIEKADLIYITIRKGSTVKRIIKTMGVMRLL